MQKQNRNGSVYQYGIERKRLNQVLNQFSRTELLIGKSGIECLRNARVAVFGIGGVGGYAVEALARSGVGSFVLIDNDKVSFTNLNRQIIATVKTIGKYKVDVMKERILDINPNAEVEIRKCFYLPENANEFDFTEYSYVVDAVDTVTAKLEIVQQAQKCKIPVISCMGAGNKLDPTKFCVDDIYKTTMCPLAKVMRRECKKRGIRKLKVVYSTEKSIQMAECQREDKEKIKEEEQTDSVRRNTPGSIAFVPSVAGMILAGEVIKDLISNI